MKTISSYIEGPDEILNGGLINNCLSALGHHSRTDDAGVSRIYQGLKAKGAVQ